MAEIKRIGVIGAGLMGSGIAQVAAQAGFNVVMRDVEDKFLERGFSSIKKSLNLRGSCKSQNLLLNRHSGQAKRNPESRFSGCPGFPLKFTLAKAGAGMTVFRTFARASSFWKKGR
ncbi:MAG: hypothetical protein FJ117_14430 [Deltaproteobacteria bacterium]|nr:hypothetical protein [Deltaproteobacteria bacterium]